MPKPQPQPHCTLDQEEGREHLRIIGLSVPQMLWTSNCKSAVTRSGHKRNPRQVTGRDPLDPIQPESIQPAYPSTHLSRGELSPKGRDQLYHNNSPLLRYHLVSIGPTDSLPRKRSARLSIKRRQKRASRPNRAPNGRKKRAEARNGGNGEGG